MKPKLFIFVLALQTAWILGTAFLQEHGLASGQVVLLETQPVDPRDLLRGDYLILSYKISDVPQALFSPPITGKLPEGVPVYVALEKRGQFHEIARASTQRLAPQNGQVLLKGNSQQGWRPDTSVRVQYGLERYYVHEGTGNPRGKITVEVAVPKSGQGVIKQVFIEGKPYREAVKQITP